MEYTWWVLGRGLKEEGKTLGLGWGGQGEGQQAERQGDRRAVEKKEDEPCSDVPFCDQLFKGNHGTAKDHQRASQN